MKKDINLIEVTPQSWTNITSILGGIYEQHFHAR